MRKAVLIVLAVAAVCLAVAGPARADDQVVKANLTLKGFDNSNIIAGFKSTDVFDPVDSCSPGTNSSCSASHSYGSPPKNIANFLCIPNAVTYSITSTCKSLLNQGVTTCHSNSLSGICRDSSEVAPACNWRTNNSGLVTWNWSLSFENGVVSVTCSNSNYQGPEQ